MVLSWQYQNTGLSIQINSKSQSAYFLSYIFIGVAVLLMAYGLLVYEYFSLMNLMMH